MTFRKFLGLLAALAPIYLILAAVLPPADDELYYWCWSQRLQLSYYDHPPMTAYMIRAATFCFGDTLFAIRLPAVVSTLTVLVVIGWLTRPRTLLPLVLFTPVFTFGAVLVTPDTPLLMFWALYLAWLVKVHEKLAEPSAKVSFGYWLCGGIILGCGILGKYTTGLGMIAGFISFIIAGQLRRWLAGYIVHGLVAVAVTLPILIHNFRYNFAPLLYQWQHSMSSPEPGTVPFLSFFGIQVLLFGFLPFAVFAWTLGHRRELAADPRLRVCACLFAVPYAFFLYKATRGHLEGNWALAVYIAVWPVAAVMVERARESLLQRRLAWASFAVPAACVVAVAVHLVHPLSPPSPAADRLTRQWSKEEIAREVEARLEGRREPLYATNYQWTALLRFHHLDARQIDGITRPSHFTQHPDTLAGRDRALVFAEGFLPDEFVAGFAPPKIVGRFPLVVRGEEVGVFWLIEYVKAGGPAGLAAASLDH
ncbi:MAG TPA: glycosyltransferase family 39 protein [Urbifossiella sp.]|nr:glycosyltransferase family 39 protein [Urbifossiella sp.]